MTLPTNTFVDQDELPALAIAATVSVSAKTCLPITGGSQPQPPQPDQPLPSELIALFDRLAELGRLMRNQAPTADPGQGATVVGSGEAQPESPATEAVCEPDLGSSLAS